MTTKSRLGWLAAMTLGVIPASAHAQSDQMQHPAPSATQAASPTGNESEVVWLRRHVVELEAQLASRGGACSPDAKKKMKSKKDSGMPSGSMGDDDMMGGGAMGAMPMNEHSMGKMKQKRDSSMKPAAPMGDDKMGGDHM